MARPRKFDEERAVDAALEAFWTAGYEATSTQDLCEATGLGRSSIYNTFHSKQDLFRRSLARYMERMTSEQVELMEGEAPVREKVGKLLDDVLRTAGRGCLSVNTAIELAGRDPEIADMLHKDNERRVAAVRAAIEAGQRAGEVDRDKDAATLARFFVSTVGGLRVSVRNGTGPRQLRAVADTALALL